MTLLLVVSVLAAAGPATAQTSGVTITQTAQGSTTVAPGDALTVDVDVQTTESGATAVELQGVPADWDVQSVDADGGSFADGEWFWLGDQDLDGSYAHTVTYEVAVPSSASDGSYQIDAVGSSQGSGGVDDDYEATDSLGITVQTPQQNQPPTAQFDVSPSAPEAGGTVTFDASASSDDGAIVDYEWDFDGDGTVEETTTSPTVTHAFASDGSYDVELTVVDGDGATGSSTQTVDVSAPQTGGVTVSQAAQGATTVAPGDTLSVDVSIETTASGAPAIELGGVPTGWTVQSVDADGGSFQSTNYEWFWSADSDLDGDYSHTVTYEVTVPSSASDGVYAIEAVGSSQGSEEVDDDYEASDVLSITVQAPQQNQDPTAQFAVSPSEPEAGETVTLDASASSDDGSIASYEWDFDGDGSGDQTTTGPTVTHAFAAAGTYDVGLTVTDDQGATDATSQQVVVSDTAPGAAEVLITPGTGTEGSSYNNGAWQVENTGDEEITVLQFDLSTTAMPDVVFDPEGSAGDQAAKGLVIDSQSGDGVGVVSTADADVFSQPHGDASGDDGYDVMTVEFTDFDPGETVTFSTDNDPTIIKGATLPSQEAGPISGLEMTRGTVTVEYADDSAETTQLFGDGSAGGAQGILDETVSAPPTIGVQDVDLDDGVLDSYHSAATVGTADRTVTISGEPGETVTLLHFEGERALDNVPDYDGTPGYDVDPYEPSKVEQVDYRTVTLDGDGDATVDVTLLNSTDIGGYNYFVATHGQPGDDTGLVSNTVILKYEQNEPPEASFAVSPSAPEAGETATFDASASSDDGSIVSYGWDFDGDGTVEETTDGPTVTHAYGSAGDYDATLTVIDEYGATDSATQSVTVAEPPNQDPTAQFDVSPSAPEAGETVTLDASASSDDGSIVSYEWTVTPPGSQPDTTLLEADFEEGSLSADGFSHQPMEDSASAGVDDATSNSGSQSAYHHGGEGAIATGDLDASGATAVEVSYWVQKGDESFSENPDANTGEDLVVEYLDDQGNWVEVDRVEDSIANGAETTGTVTFTDSGALHDGLQIRFRQEGASIASGDFWHVDDVSVTAINGGSQQTTLTGETATFTPPTSGDHQVTLVVTDDEGATDSTTRVVGVTAQQTESIPAAVASLDDSGDDSQIGTSEIQQAIDLWVDDDPVPGTDGQTISTADIQQLIDMWVSNESVDSNEKDN
jgi:PKD repeat protein